MTSAPRPLSPHLQIYKWQLTATLSILHRFTGIALSAGAPFLVWWLVAAAAGNDAFATARWFFGSWLGLLLLLGWTFSFFFHLCNGIRHLVWDSGRGFDLTTTYATGWAAVATSAVLTVVAFVGGMLLRG